jgi:hypothetical protein
MLGPIDDYSTLYNSEALVGSAVGVNEYVISHKCRSQGGHIKKIDKDPADHMGKGSSLENLEGKQQELFDTASTLLNGDSSYRVVLPTPFNTYLESFGMRFPSGALSMNSVSPSLEDLYGLPPNLEGVWEAQGHKYVIDTRMTRNTICGGFGTPVATRGRYWTTDFCLEHIDHVGGACQFPFDPFYVYTAGVAAPTLVGGEGVSKGPGGIILV